MMIITQKFVLGQSYDFENDVQGFSPTNITSVNGTAVVNSHPARSKTLNPQSIGSGNTAAYNLDLIPAESNYLVTWKETYTGAGATGITLRASGSNSINAGIMQGYLFQTNPAQNELRIYTSDVNGYTLLSSQTLLAPEINDPRWYRAKASGDTLTFEYSNDGTLFIQVDSLLDATYSSPGFTQLTSGYGSPINTSYIDEIEFLKIPSIQVKSINNYQVIQRNNSNEADINISGTYWGQPSSIEASYNGGPYEIIDFQPAGGTFSGVLSDQIAGQGELIVRFTNDQLVNTSIQHVGIGDVFIIAGQSNACGRGATMNTYNHPSLKASLFGNDDLWKELADGTDEGTNQVDSVSFDIVSLGSPWPLVATSILADTDVPVAFVPTAKGGTSISDWLPASIHSNDTTLFGSMYRRIIEIGGEIKGVLFFQGEFDANNGTSQSDYADDLETIVDAIAADFYGAKTLIGQIGYSNFSGNDEIRAGQIEVVNNNTNALLGPATYDIDLADDGGDAIHFKWDDDMAEFARRWSAAISKEYYGGNDGYGPILNTSNLIYEVANNKIILTFNDETIPEINTSSNVTPSSFILENDGNPVTISGVSLTNNTVEITPSNPLNTSEVSTLTYASLNSAVDAAIYDSNDLPAQPFYEIEIPYAPISPTFGTDVQVSCDSYTWIDGNSYTSDNSSATDTLINSVGGDSIVTLDLTINNSTFGIDQQSVCKSFTWIDGNTYTESIDTVTYTLINAQGCDSIVTLDLTIRNVSDVSTSVNGSTITSINSNASYQWLECNNDYEAIQGQTFVNFEAIENGSYAVEITENGCIDTSACTEISTIGLVSQEFGEEFILYPNPTDGEVNIKLENSYNDLEVVVRNLFGQIMSRHKYMSTEQLELSINGASGIYLIEIIHKDLTSVMKVIKE